MRTQILLHQYFLIMKKEVHIKEIKLYIEMWKNKTEQNNYSSDVIP